MTLALGAVVSLTAGCASSAGSQASSPAAKPTVLSVGAKRVAAAPATTAGRAIAAFGGKIFLADSGIAATSNAAISPYSIYTALAMTRAGAKGSTAAQLDRALGGSEKAQAADVTAVDDAVKGAVSSAGSHRSKGVTPMVVSTANSIWTDSSLAVHQAYLTRLAAGYGAGVHTVDFQHNPGEARALIDGWVKKRTNNLIPQLLGPHDVTDQTRLELVDALYLKARWANPMRTDQGHDPFTTAAGTTEQTSYMSVETSLRLVHGAGWQAVTIPYKGGGLAMTIVLPDGGEYAAVRRQLPTVIDRATHGGNKTRVSLRMPKFSLSTHTGLIPALQKLGVRDLFGQADLSGIAGRPGQLKVASVIHQSVVKVDRFGTEAAAATGVGVVIGAVPGPTSVVPFTVDRAFFFVIHDTTTGAPLFLGQVADPNSR